MANRSTMLDVAREAGVSLATVDRALNGRAVVRKDTVERILAAARRVGYHGTKVLEARLGSGLKPARLGFILLRQHSDFYRQFAGEIERAVQRRADIHGTAIIRYPEEQTPEAFKALIEKLGPKVDALACVSVNHQKLNVTVSAIQTTGVPVYALLSDFAQGIRRAYVGLNNMKVGRAAGWALTSIARRPGKLAVFVGGLRWHGHDLREVGFRAFVRENAPSFSVLDTFVNLDSPEVTYEATLDILYRNDDIAGIFVASGGTHGAIRALREVRPPGKVPLVVTELTGTIRTALTDGYVTMSIATPLRELCEEAVGMMVQEMLGGSAEIAGQHFLQPLIHLGETL